MIPKKIHYVTIEVNGGLTPIEKGWTEETKKNNPDAEVKIWTEKDIPSSKFLERCLEGKEYDKLTNYIKFYVLYHEGGICLDKDIVFLKKITYEWTSEFKTIITKTNPWWLSTSIMGGGKKTRFYKECLFRYTQDNISIYDLINQTYKKIYGVYSTRHNADSSIKSTRDFNCVEDAKLHPCHPTKDIDLLYVRYFDNYTTNKDIKLEATEV